MISAASKEHIAGQPGAAPPPPQGTVSYQTRPWWQLRREPRAIVALSVLGCLLVLILVVPSISPFGVQRVNGLQAYAPMGAVDSISGEVHWLGTDYIGRDFMVRLFEAGRIPILVALVSTALIVVIGSLVGTLAGYYGGWVDAILMRFTDFMLALPLLPLYLLVLRLLRSLPNLQSAWRSPEINPVLTLGVITGVFTLLGWMGLARLVRGTVLSLRTVAYVEASRALGAGPVRIMFRHLLPNSIAPVIVAATFAVGDFIVLEAILAYFFQGISDPPFVTWGNMLPLVQGLAINITNLNPLQDIRAYLFLLPSLMIFITVLCINYIGDALRNALDPHGT